MILSVAEVAEICEVTPVMVVGWLNSGRLRGYRIPGKRYWRIPKKRLIDFIQMHYLPDWLNLMEKAVAYRT